MARFRKMKNRSQHAEKDIRYHAATAHDYDAVVVHPRELANEILFGEIEAAIPQGGRMLDLGCGTGHSVLRFGQRFDAVVGVDHSPEMLAQALAKLETSQSNNVVLLCQNLFDFIGSVTTRFDFITAIGCFHHLQPETLPGVLRSVSRILRPGGRVLIADPIRVDLSKQPAEVAEWNAASVAIGLDFTSDEEEADEAPLDHAALIDALSGAGLEPVAETRGWELFPHALPPSAEDRREITRLHRAFGSSGNVLCTVYRKP
ncbi:MAG: class I SAM-dependent methyltransferase [Xanthomonadales bacterium]|jgi:SAM-dependent methyltransferase|nr:class I SAM-dependent methyltransferase [Xanthomonadales bacterium]